MKPTLVLFDIDGTLVDTAGAGRRAIERAFTEVLQVDGSAAWSTGIAFAGMTDWSIFDALTAASGVTPARAASSRDALVDCYVRELEAEMATPDPRRRVLRGVTALIERLIERADITLGLLTGNLERGARVKLEPFGLNRYFDTGGFGSDHRERADVARIAHERLTAATSKRFDPDRVFVIGDTDQDVACAHANGFRAIAVEAGWGSRDSLLAAGPEFLFPDLSAPGVYDALGFAQSS